VLSLTRELFDDSSVRTSVALASHKYQLMKCVNQLLDCTLSYIYLDPSTILQIDGMSGVIDGLKIGAPE
jgi:hypothetical protein